MSAEDLNQVIRGALVMAASVAGLFFVRFWVVSRDRLFLFMGVAFWALALNWLGLALVPWIAETRHYVFIVRLLAFVLIIIGIVDKNRRGSAS